MTLDEDPRRTLLRRSALYVFVRDAQRGRDGALELIDPRACIGGVYQARARAWMSPPTSDQKTRQRLGFGNEGGHFDLLVLGVEANAARTEPVD